MSVEVLPSNEEASILLDSDHIVEYIRENHARIKLVFLPGVHYVTGERLDVGRIAKTCQEFGLIFGLDLAHAVGSVFDLDLHENGVDFAVFCTYKYLNAGPGNLGGFYVHEKHFSRPRLAGWWGASNKFNFDSSEAFQPSEGADGWQLGNPPNLLLASLVAALEVFDQNWKGLPAVNSDEEVAFRLSCSETAKGQESKAQPYFWTKAKRGSTHPKPYAGLQRKTQHLKMYFKGILTHFNLIPSSRFRLGVELDRCGAHVSLAVEGDMDWQDHFIRQLKKEAVVVDSRRAQGSLMLRFALCALYVDFIDVYRLAGKVRDIVEAYDAAQV